MKGRITAPAFPPAGGRAGGGEGEEGHTIAVPAPPAPPPPPHGRCGARSASPRRRTGPRLLPRTPGSPQGRGPQPHPNPVTGTGGGPGRGSAPLPSSPPRSGRDFVDFLLPGQIDPPSYRKTAPRRCLYDGFTRGCAGERTQDPSSPPRLSPPLLYRDPPAMRGGGSEPSRRVEHPTPAPAGLPVPQQPLRLHGGFGEGRGCPPCRPPGPEPAAAGLSHSPRWGAQWVPAPRAPLVAPHSSGAAKGPLSPSPGSSPPGSALAQGSLLFSHPKFPKGKGYPLRCPSPSIPPTRQGCSASPRPSTGDETESSPQFSPSAKIHGVGGGSLGMGPLLSKTSPLDALYLPPLVPKQPTPLPSL